MFEHAIHVEDGDIDMLGHASNIAFIRWIQEAAIAHSQARGLDVEGYKQLGAFFVVRRHEVDYLRPVLRGDRLLLRTWIDSAAAAKCERAVDVIRLEDNVTVARARTIWGFVEARTGRPTRIPDEIRVAFGFPPRRTSSSPPRGPEALPALESDDA